jgi:hypothetical protein
MVAKDHDFDYLIKDSYRPEAIGNTETKTNTINTEYKPSDTTTWTGDWFYNYPLTSNTYNWSYTRLVYMYQIFCPKPRCKGVFWGEIDQVAVCPKCSSRVKVTDSPPPDYEVEVTK